MDDLLVFTPLFDFDGAKIHYLNDSCARCGVALQTYGSGPWPGYIGGKISAAIPFLESRQEPYVLFCDASDVLMVRDVAGLLETFRSFKKPLVISGERDCFPLTELASRFPAADSGYSYPNAGGYIGERDAVILALQTMDRTFEDGEDQARWIRLVADNPSSIAIDQQCAIFQTMSGGAAADVKFNAFGPFNARTLSRPYFLHFNGRTAGIEEAYRQCFA